MKEHSNISFWSVKSIGWIGVGLGVAAILVLPQKSKASNKIDSSSDDLTPDTDAKGESLSLPINPVLVNSYGFRPMTRNNQARGCDPKGCGHYHASRGSRLHQGIDLVTTIGQPIYAGIHGRINRHLRVYSNDVRYTGLEIQGTDIHSAYKMKVFYLTQMLAVNTLVTPNSFIGMAQNIALKYPSITNHIHIELYQNGTRINPTSFLTT